MGSQERPSRRALGGGRGLGLARPAKQGWVFNETPSVGGRHPPCPAAPKNVFKDGLEKDG